MRFLTVNSRIKQAHLPRHRQHWRTAGLAHKGRALTIYLVAWPGEEQAALCRSGGLVEGQEG